MTTVSLHRFRNDWYRPGRPRWVLALWFFAGLPLLRCAVLPSSGVRVWLLRRFGAHVGARAVIRPGVRIKYPWNLFAGDDCWIGEDCWIDNLAPVCLGNDVCLSQGAYLCTGNHDWSDPEFGLKLGEIRVHDGAWIGAKAVLAPGVTVGKNAIAALGSVSVKDIPPGEVHAGNPAQFVRKRKLREARQSYGLLEEAGARGKQ